ncbi:hypothetical protein SFRURICE_017117 [Spodoptera frugiperda]|nr:hypothetical protein SFRURICE_017117 [Spodoptera frugiperda]
MSLPKQHFLDIKVSIHRVASYASHPTDFNLSSIETHTTASTDPHHQQCLHAMRTDDVIRNMYDAYDAGLWTLTFILPHWLHCHNQNCPVSNARYNFHTLTANRKLLKANSPLTSVTGDHHGVQCVNVPMNVCSFLVVLFFTYLHFRMS